MSAAAASTRAKKAPRKAPGKAAPAAADAPAIMQGLSNEGAAPKDVGAGVEQLIKDALEDGRLMPAQKQWAQGLGKSNIAALKGYLDSARPIRQLRGSVGEIAAGAVYIRKRFRPAHAVAGVYRGPDRRSGSDRRGGEQLPHANEQRSGIERRNKLRGDAWAVGGRLVTVHSALAYEVEPLLALCEFALLAHQALSAMNRAAAQDAPLMERLAGIDPAWNVLLDGEAGTAQHIGQCLLIVRGLVRRQASAAQEASEQALGLSMAMGSEHA